MSAGIGRDGDGMPLEGTSGTGNPGEDPPGAVKPASALAARPRDKAQSGRDTGGTNFVIWAALAANACIAVAKFVAAGITGSSAMLTEGFHSVVDTSNEILLLYGQHRGRRKPDRIHPLGYGREVYFWSFVVALLIFATGAGMSIYEGTLHILHPEPISQPAINYAVLGISLLLEGASWTFAVRQFLAMKGECGWYEAIHRSKNPPGFIVFLEDSAAIAGILIATAGVYLSARTNDPVYDGTASILIGLVLAAVAVLLARETKHLLIGEAADPGIGSTLQDLARERPEIWDVAEVITMQMGPDSVIATMHIAIRDTVAAGQIGNMIRELEDSLKSAWPEVRRLYVALGEEELAPMPPTD
jgi:cation diffusion facilitator family transporter